MCLKDDAYTDSYTAFATGELRATPPTVLCSVPLKHIIQENGKFCGFRFHSYLCRRRTGMVILMKKLLAFTLALTMILMLSACGNQSAQSQPSNNATSGDATEPIVLTTAVATSDDHVYAVGLRYLNDILKEKTGGRISLNIFSNSSLGSEREAVEGTTMGSIDMTLITADGALPAWVPGTQVLSIPYLANSDEEMFALLDEFLPDKLADEYDSANLYCLGYAALGWRNFTNNKRPITSAADMKGLLIRVQEATVWFSLCDALQCQAVPVAFSELYTALQQGTVDGQENPLGTISAQKYNEVQKYMCLDGHTYGAGAIIINKSTWNQLSSKDRVLLQESVNEAVAKQREYVQNMNDTYLQQLKDSGMIVCEDPDIESFVEATKGIGNREDVKDLFNDPTIIEAAREFISTVQ